MVVRVRCKLHLLSQWFGSLCFALFALLLLSWFDIGILFFGNGGEQVNSEEKFKGGGYKEKQRMSKGGGEWWRVAGNRRYW